MKPFAYPLPSPVLVLAASFAVLVSGRAFAQTTPPTLPTLTTLRSFSGANGDGDAENTGLIQGNDGNFYGVTTGGGTNASGLIYKLTPAGNFGALYSFGPINQSAGNADGAQPWAPLIQGADGNFYGTTASGLPAGRGGVFRLSPGGMLSIVYGFRGPTSDGAPPLDGARPHAALVQGANGNFYGTTTGGGSNGAGTIFQVSPAGTLLGLYSLDYHTIGYGPEAGLLLAADGNFYGTTSGGGANAGDGVIFKFTSDGTLTALHSLGEQDGSVPLAPLIQGADGSFYGTASQFGLDPNFGYGGGTVFKITPDGGYTKLHVFDPNDGFAPVAALLQASDGNFYGTTSSGGDQGRGTIFQITPDGTFSVVHRFEGSDGAFCQASLIQANDGFLYGTTTNGGAYGHGTIFRLETALPPVVRFNATMYSVNEGAGGALVRVDRIGGVDALSVQYSTTDGTALAGTDYTNASGTFSWAANDQSARYIYVPLIDRNLADNSARALSLTLSDPVGGNTLGNPASTTLTINSPYPLPVITSVRTLTAIVNQPFSYQITASGHPVAFNAVFQDPLGLSVDPATGIISGTPDRVGTFSIPFSASNAAGAGTATLVLTVTVAPPVITSALTANGARGVDFVYQITNDSFAVSYAATGLPPGLALDTGTGQITGKPTAPGTYSVTISASNPGGTDTKTLAITIAEVPPVITSALNPAIRQGVSFSYQITAANAPTSFAASSLPAGLTLDPATGKISGHVTTFGTFTAGISATNSAGTGTATLTLNVKQANPVFTSPSTVYIARYTPFSFQLVATNDTTRYGASALPAGVSINQNTGLITGSVAAAGQYVVTIAAFNSGGSGVANLTIVVTAQVPVITSPATAPAIQGAPFSYRITATGNPTKYGAAHLPAGLTVNQTTGVISGTPAVVGTFAVTLGAFNDVGGATGKLTLTVNEPAPVITSSLNPPSQQGVAFSYQITATNNPTKYGESGIPAGLTINQATGKISGTPMKAGTYSVTIAAFNSGGSGSAKLTLVVKPPA